MAKKFDFDFTVTQLKRILPRNVDIEKLYDSLTRILTKYDITSKERVACFIGQCAVESYQFTVMTENLNYSATGLLTVFPSQFNNKQAKDYQRQPEKIANRVYANRLGNGDEKSGDGWKFRGQGFLQITGRWNHTEFAKYLGMPLEQELVYIRTLDGAIEASCWFWNMRNLSLAADRLDLESITLRVNGKKMLHHQERVFFTRKALSVFNDEDGIIPEVLKRGDQGAAVFELQKRLTQKGYRVTIDGQFGIGTENAVKQLQADAGMKPDGIVGPKTRILL